MLGRGPLWKNIGKQGAKSPQSSLSSAGRPIKAFHIMFEDASRSEAQSDTRRKASQLLKNSSSIRQDLDGSPMMIITDDVCERENNEKVLEVISFDSHENERMMSMDHVLKSMTQISEKEKEDKYPPHGSRNDDSFSLPLVPVRMKQPTIKLNAIMNTAHNLRQDLQSYRYYLLNAISEWEVQAINNFKALKERIEAALVAYASQAKINDRDREKEKQREESSKCYALQQEVAMLGRSLALERQAREVQRRQNADLQQKIRRIQRSENEQRLKVGSQLAQLEELRSKNKRLQIQLNEAKLDIGSQAAKATKLKEVIREREILISSQNQETSQLEKRIKELKLAIQQSSNRERRAQIELKSLRQRLESDREGWQKELSRAKSQVVKLKGLLAVSEQQLSQCQDYINKLNLQIKQQHIQTSKLHERLRNNEAQYIQKLRDCDQYLVQLENSMKDMSIAQEKKQEQCDAKQAELSRLSEELQNKAIELRNRQGQIQQLKREYQHKILSISRREDGMKAEYRMAIDIQNAAKDKWYQRYYTMFSPERERQRNEPVYSPPHRDVPFSGRTSAARKEPPDTREGRSPIRDRLFKAKSERNFNLNFSPRKQVPSLSSARNEAERCESQRDLVSLGSRISTLRRELTRQLGQIGIKP